MYQAEPCFMYADYLSDDPASSQVLNAMRHSLDSDHVFAN